MNEKQTHITVGLLISHLTVTFTVFVIPLHLTVILQLPFFLAVIFPLLLTIAIFLLDEAYVTVADGVVLTVKVFVFPFFRVTLVGVTVSVGFFTVTLQVSFTVTASDPFFALIVAVIVAVPAFFEVTFPDVLLTMATDVLLDLKETDVIFPFFVDAFRVKNVDFAAPGV